MKVLGEVLGEVGRRHPRPFFDGLHVTRADLAVHDTVAFAETVVEAGLRIFP